MGQFPHAFPSWIAIGYGLDGLSGARRAVGAWAILGLLAVYFAGARLAGRAPAFVAALLLGHQCRRGLVRAVSQLGDDAAGAAVRRAAGARASLSGRRPVLRAGGGGAARLADVRAAGFAGPARCRRREPAAARRRREAPGLGLRRFPGGAARRGGRVLRRSPAGVPRHPAAAGGRRAPDCPPRWRRWSSPDSSWPPRARRGAGPGRGVQPWVPRVLAGRWRPPRPTPTSCASPPAASPLTTPTRSASFGWYVGPLGPARRRRGIRGDRLDAVLERPRAADRGRAGRRLLLLQDSDRSRALLAGTALPAGHPAVCLRDDGGGRIRGLPAPPRAGRRCRFPCARGCAPRSCATSLAPLAVLAFVGWTFVAATRPILDHVEYAGLIPAVERLAGQFGDRDLVLVEPRILLRRACAGDAAGLRLRTQRAAVLLAAPGPRREVGRFLSWAGRDVRPGVPARGRRLHLASSQHRRRRRCGIERFSIPEYESARNAYPREVRQKKFDLYLYRLRVQRDQALPPVLDLDIGGFDDPWVLPHVHAPGAGRRHVSVAAAIGRSSSLPACPASARAIVLRAGDGGRPARPARRT